MPLSERDTALVEDMLVHARLISAFVEGISVDQYLADRKTQLAVERLIEIIGEAARGMSKAFRDSEPDIPWRGIIGQRNVLAHEYGEVKQERIWNVASREIPILIRHLERLTSADPE